MNCPPEIADILLEIVYTGLLNVRVAGWSGDAAACAAEADHLHNLPGLLRNFSKEKLRYYWDVERTSFLERSSASKQAQAYADAWTRLQVALESETVPTLSK